MSGPRIGELFSGYGGLGMGVQAVYGGTIAWHSDIDKGARKILAHRYPDVPNLGDITTIDWSTVEPVDILTGGSPCQDLSGAGKRAGMTEGTRSNLWVAMREAIAQLRPAVVVWENVRGAYSAGADSALEFCAGCMGDPWYRGTVLRALGRVLGDLSDLGYDASWHGLRAADVGAPHGRFRVFVVATDTTGNAGPVPHGDGRGAAPALLPTPSCSDTNGAGQHGDGGLDLRTAVRLLPTASARDYKDHTIRREPHRPDDVDTLARALTDVPCALLPTPAVNDMGEGKTVERWDEWTADMQAKHGNGNGHGKSLAIEAQRLAHYWATWGDYGTAIRRWEHILGRPAPAPTTTSTKGNPQLSPVFVEWLMGLPAGWVIDVPGITRNEALKALGNGVVPQQAAAALRLMASWRAVA